MKNTRRILITFAFVAATRFAFAADAETQSRELITKVRSDVTAGKRSEVTLGDDLRLFDAFIAEHKEKDANAAARILFMKAQLYSEVLDDSKKADSLVQQLKTDFKGTKFVADFEKQEAAQAEAKKIQAALKPGAKFPDFVEKDLADKPLSIEKYKGKVVLVDFWATWCGPCVAELPNVQAVFQKYHKQGFEIVGVSLDDEKPQLENFLAKHPGMTWPQYFDGQGWENKLALKYGIHSIPATYLIDRNGNIIAKKLRGDELAAAVAAALSKK